MLLNILLILLALFCLFYCYVIYVFSGDAVDIDITAEELESDLYAGLHLYGRDE